MRVCFAVEIIEILLATEKYVKIPRNSMRAFRPAVPFLKDVAHKDKLRHFEGHCEGVESAHDQGQGLCPQ